MFRVEYFVLWGAAYSEILKRRLAYRSYVTATRAAAATQYTCAGAAAQRQRPSHPERSHPDEMTVCGRSSFWPILHSPWTLGLDRNGLSHLRKRTGRESRSPAMTVSTCGACASAAEGTGAVQRRGDGEATWWAL